MLEKQHNHKQTDCGIKTLSLPSSFLTCTKKKTGLEEKTAHRSHDPTIVHLA
tara:strand:- start:275 stop:430 length:156 start_codon:yes stop_codon:yes gene_type:complete